MKNRQGRYIDVRSIFPTKIDQEEAEPLPEEPADIVKLAVKKAKEQPVLFWGESSVYASCNAWPKDQQLVPVAVKLSLGAKKFFDELMEA